MLSTKVLTSLLLSLIGLGMSRTAQGTTSDSCYVDTSLHASTAPPANPARPVAAARAWETALRFPGRIVSLPLVVMGNLTERSMLYLERTNARERVPMMIERSKQLGIAVMPASLADHTGLGGEVRWSPHPLQDRVRMDLNLTTSQYNRERVSGFWGPVSAVYASEWLPRELYFGPGLTAPLSGESSYGERTQSARLQLTWGWQSFDTTQVKRSEPLMFRDRVRLRGVLHRTWVSAWAGPREASVTHGRDPDSPSFEVLHPLEAAGSLDQSIEQFVYGAGLSHDARSGRPHWSRGWRGSVEAERYDKSIQALAFNDAHSGAHSFTRMTYHFEGGASFGRDPRTLRLALTAIDQQLDAAGGTFLVSDLEALGGSTGLAGYEYDRFRDLDLVLGKLSYIFPLAKNAEFDLHGESGGVYSHMSQARVATLKGSFGAALRLRTETGMLGAVGCDWSPEKVRISFSLGGVE